MGQKCVQLAYTVCRFIIPVFFPFVFTWERGWREGERENERTRAREREREFHSIYKLKALSELLSLICCLNYISVWKQPLGDGVLVIFEALYCFVLINWHPLIETTKAASDLQHCWGANFIGLRALRTGFAYQQPHSESRRGYLYWLISLTQSRVQSSIDWFSN